MVAERHCSVNQGHAQLLLINTGNANAGTGAMGITAAEKCCDAVADMTSVNRSDVLPFSTGVIGEPLDADRIAAALPVSHLRPRADNWQRAAAAILTTDTRPKLRTIDVEVDGKSLPYHRNYQRGGYDLPQPCDDAGLYRHGR